MTTLTSEDDYDVNIAYNNPHHVNSYSDEEGDRSEIEYGEQDFNYEQYKPTQEELKEFEMGRLALQRLKSDPLLMICPPKFYFTTSWNLWIDRTILDGYGQPCYLNLQHINNCPDSESLLYTCYNVPPPSTLNFESSLHMMTDMYVPDKRHWTHNSGGIYQFQCLKEYSEYIWKSLLHLISCERLNGILICPNQIIGVSVSPGESFFDTIYLWNTNASIANPVAIFCFLKTYFMYLPLLNLEYKPHWQ